MQFPIDTSGLAFMVAAPPAPARDFSTKKAKVTEDGEPVMQVTVLAMDGTDSMKIKFTVVGQVDVRQGQPIRIHGLRMGSAREGEIRWWQADRIEPLGGFPVGEPAAGAGSAVFDQTEGLSGGRRAGRNPHSTARHSAPSSPEGPMPGGGAA